MRALGSIIAATSLITGFVASHPLAKQVGPWPAVFTVAALTAGATYLIAAPGREPQQTVG